MRVRLTRTDQTGVVIYPLSWYPDGMVLVTLDVPDPDWGTQCVECRVNDLEEIKENEVNLIQTGGDVL